MARLFTRNSKSKNFIKTTASQKETGATLLEASLSLGVLCILALVGMELVRISYTAIAGQYAVSRTARWAMLGETIDLLDREASIVEKLRENSAKVGISIDTSNVRICPLANLNCPSNSAGSSNDVFHVAYTHSIGPSVVGNDIQLSFGAFAKSEPF